MSWRYFFQLTQMIPKLVRSYPYWINIYQNWISIGINCRTNWRRVLQQPRVYIRMYLCAIVTNLFRVADLYGFSTEISDHVQIGQSIFLCFQLIFNKDSKNFITFVWHNSFHTFRNFHDLSEILWITLRFFEV